MANTLIRTYDNFDSAQQVRQALLSSGFSLERIHLSATEDEAGPVASNFVLDEKDNGQGPGSERGGSEERTPAHHTPGAQWRASCILTVDAQDDDERARAKDIMDRYGAVNVEARAARGTNSTH